MAIVHYLAQEKVLKLLESFHDIHNTFPQVVFFTNSVLQVFRLTVFLANNVQKFIS